MPKDNINKIYLIFIQPFIDIVSTGNDNISQEGSAIYLSDFIYHLGSEKNDFNNKILDTLDDKIIHLCTKSSLDNPYLFESLYNLIQFTPIENYKKFIDDLYKRFIVILCKVNRNKYNFETKIFCLKILNLIAFKVKNNKDIINDFYEENIIKIIESNVKDKVLKVQNSAKEALINWYELKDKFEEKENENNKNKEKEKEDNSNLENKNNPNRKMDKLNFLRDLAKMAKKENNKIDYDSELPQKMKEEVYKKGIGNILQLSRFLNNMKNKANENQLRNSLNKKNKQKKEINDFLKQTKQMDKYNEYKKEEENNLNNNKFGFQIEDVKSGDQAENTFVNNDIKIEENINEEDEKSENNKLKNSKNKKREKNKSDKKKKKKKSKKKQTEEYEEDENENKSVKEEDILENEKNKNNGNENAELLNTTSNVKISEVDEEKEENDNNENKENDNNENKENENNEEEIEINDNSNIQSKNEESINNFKKESNDLEPIDNIINIESEKENNENEKEEIENENKSNNNNKSNSELNSRRNKKKQSKKEEETNNNFYDTNKKKLEEISNENKSNKENGKSNKTNSRKEKYNSDEESDTDNYLEDDQNLKKENKKNLSKIKRQESNKSNEFNKLKQTLQLMLDNKLFKSINNFEKKINSKLDKLKNKLDNVSEKILKYDKNKNQKTKEKTKKEEDNLIKQKTLMYKEVLNDIKNDLLSSQRNNNEINNDSKIMKIWKDTLNNIEKKKYNDAYTLILNSGDDIYLLRLIYLTGIIFDKLSPEICRNILKRINLITRSYQIQSLLINLVKNSIQCNMFNTLNENEQNDILDTLYEIAGNNSPISKDASEIYTYITQ